MKLSGKVKFMIYVSSNDAATVQSFIGIFKKSYSDNNDRLSFLLVMEYFEMLYREICQE